jgi:flagellar basal-body rod modification protein FlgD
MSLTINQTPGTSAATPTTSAAASVGAATGGSASLATEQTFLQLLVAQLANQDPLQPTQGTDFVTQLAQFAQVEQSENQTTALQGMSSQLTGLSNNDTTQLVGKTVTIQGNTVTYDGSVATPSNVTLASNASSVTATISDSNGNVVRTLHLGGESAGAVNVPWDGHEDGGANAPAGTYTVNVTASDSSGNAVGVTQSVTGVVQNVSFAQGYAELTLTSGAQAPVSQLVSVGTTSTPTSP